MTTTEARKARRASTDKWYCYSGHGKRIVRGSDEWADADSTNSSWCTRCKATVAGEFRRTMAHFTAIAGKPSRKPGQRRTPAEKVAEGRRVRTDLPKTTAEFIAAVGGILADPSPSYKGCTAFSPTKVCALDRGHAGQHRWNRI